MNGNGNDRGLEEYAEFVAAQPIEHEAALREPTVTTAYWAARRAGWTNEHLAPDAAATFRRGGGVGLVVTRLRTLAESRPADRSKAGKGDRTMRCPRGCGKPHYSDQSCECVICHQHGAFGVVNGTGPVHASCYSGREYGYESSVANTVPPPARSADEHVLTQEQIGERMRLLGLLQRRRAGADEGEQAMRELMDRQYAR